MRLQLRQRADLGELAAGFHLPVPRQLALRMGPGLFRAGPAWHPAEVRDRAGDLGGDAKPDVAATHFWEANHVAGAAGIITQVQFTPPDTFMAPTQIAVVL